MRNFLLALVLLTVSTFWAGCGSTNTSNKDPLADTTDNGEKIIKQHEQADKARASNGNSAQK
jgi:hypothetical protein